MKKGILSLVLVLYALFGFGQLDIVKRTVTLDSINARGTAVYINDSVYIRDTSIFDLMQKYVTEGSITLGTANQIPFVNSTATDLGYSDNFKFTGNALELVADSGYSNVFVGVNSGLTITTGEQNTFIGDDAGKGDTHSGTKITGLNNTFVGYASGLLITDGNYNTFIGSATGLNLNSGINNVCIGALSGQNIENNKNVLIGSFSGFSNTSGSGNVFIGDSSGYSEMGSNKLYIENSNSATPLIWGDFANDSVRINGVLEVTGNLVVGQKLIHDIYEASAYVPEDSTLTTSATTAWQFLGEGSNNKFFNIYAEGFSFDGDTLQWNQDVTDLRDSVEFNVSWSTSSSSGTNGILVSYGLNIKNDSEPTYTVYNPTTRSNRLATSGQQYSWSCTPMPIFLKDGAKIQIIIKASGAATITTEDFGIYIREE